MSLYIVSIEEVLVRNVRVTAEDTESALRIVQEKYKNEEITLDYSDHVTTEFYVCKCNNK